MRKTLSSGKVWSLVGFSGAPLKWRFREPTQIPCVFKGFIVSQHITECSSGKVYSFFALWIKKKKKVMYVLYFILHLKNALYWQITRFERKAGNTKTCHKDSNSVSVTVPI